MPKTINSNELLLTNSKCCVDQFRRIAILIWLIYFLMNCEFERETTTIYTTDEHNVSDLTHWLAEWCLGRGGGWWCWPCLPSASGDPCLLL